MWQGPIGPAKVSSGHATMMNNYRFKTAVIVASGSTSFSGSSISRNAPKRSYPGHCALILCVNRENDPTDFVSDSQHTFPSREQQIASKPLPLNRDQHGET